MTSIEDIENLPGILALKAMLREVADTLAGTTRNGKDLQGIFATIVNDSSMFLGTIFGEGGFDGALTSAMEAAKEIWPIVRAMASEFRGGFMEGFGPFVAEVRRAVARQMRQRRQRMLTATVYDGLTEFDLTFFKAWGHETKLVPGARAIVAGTLGRFNNRWQLAHPEYELLEDEAAGAEFLDEHTRRPIPLYPTTERIYSWKIRDAVRLALDSLDRVEDPVPPQVRASRGLLDRATALERVHRPRDRGDIAAATHRLRYDEAFTLQTVLAQRRLAASALPAGWRTTRRPRASPARRCWPAAASCRLSCSMRRRASRCASCWRDKCSSSQANHVCAWLRLPPHRGDEPGQCGGKQDLRHLTPPSPS